MANVLYNKGKQSFLSKEIDMIGDTIKAALIDTGVYTFSQSHQFYSSLSGVIGTDQTLGTKSVTDGVFDAADATFPTVSGSSVEAIAVYHSTGVAGTSRLIAFIDTGTGLPFTPNGGNVNVVWDNGSSKIFAL